MVMVAFQIAFRAEKHVNNVFLFFKNHFWYQHIKTIQKVQTVLNFNKKKLKFCKKQVAPQPQTASKFLIILKFVELEQITFKKQT